MSLEIDFIPFATGGGAGVETQAAWVVDTVVTNGFVTGIAQSTQVNKAIRQPSFVAAAISNFMGNVINQNILDNGVLNTYWSQFWQAILGSTSFVDTGSANAVVIAAPSGLTFPAPVAGLCITVKIAANSTGSATLNWMGNGNKNITYPNTSAFAGGELVAGGYSTFTFDGTQWQLTEISPNAFLSKGYCNRTFTTAVNYSVVAGDGGKNISVTAAGVTVNFTSGYITSGNGPVLVGNYSGYSSTITAGSGSFIGSSLGGATSITIAAKGWVAVEPDGSNLRIVSMDPTTSNAAGTVTSVAVSGGSTGLTTSGGPITSSGTITLAGTLALASGGTGATTAAAARSNLGSGTGPSNLQLFTSSGTFTPPTGITLVKVTVTGGGGGGTGCKASGGNYVSGAGGGAGGTVISLVSVTPGVGVTVTVGSGGSAGSGTTNGGNGQNSSFGSITAGGGSGGSWISATSAAGGPGGTNSGGTLQPGGGWGGDGQAGGFIFTGNGGSSFYGGGGRAGADQGESSYAAGAGGGGSYDGNNSNTAFSGGLGGAGIVVVEW